MSAGRRFFAFLTVLMVCFWSATALATTKVHLTGPAKELAQFVGQRFVIGVTATGFDTGEVTITGPTQSQTLTMVHRRRNYLEYTPLESGSHTITATVHVDGKARVWTSQVTITVYPVDASDRAAWMVRTALESVGSTDVEAFVMHTSLTTDDDWCAAYIGWCARKVCIPRSAGLEALFAGVDLYSDIGKDETIACKTCAGNHKARFLGTVLKNGELPEPGDLVFFIWGSKEKAQQAAHPGYQTRWHGNANHVGIVTEVAGTSFSFVHGNVNMGHRKYGVALNRSSDEKEGKTFADWVVAFARPHYAENGTP